jgi:hypothetical protein
LGTFNVNIIYNMNFLTIMGCYVEWHVPIRRGKKCKTKTMPNSRMLSSFITNASLMKIFSIKVFIGYKHEKIIYGDQNVLTNLTIFYFKQ